MKPYIFNAACFGSTVLEQMLKQIDVQPQKRMKNTMKNRIKLAGYLEKLFLLAESKNLTSLKKKEKNLSSRINDLYNHRTLLHVACRMGNVEMVEYFLSLPNIDVNKGVFNKEERDGDRITSLCAQNLVKIAMLLLSHPSIDVNKGSSVSVLQEFNIVSPRIMIYLPCLLQHQEKL